MGDITVKLSHVLCTGLASVLALVCATTLQSKLAAPKKDVGLVSYPSTPGSPGPVVFSHLTHGTRGAGYTCAKCHPDGTAKAPLVTMAGIRQGQTCGACHNGKTKGPRTHGLAPAVQECGACHMPTADIVIKLKRMDPVTFSHLRHLGIDPTRKATKPVGFSCQDCHPVPFERAKGPRTSDPSNVNGGCAILSERPLGMDVPHDEGACAVCHNGQKRSDGLPTAFAANTHCLTCHRSPATPSADAPPTP
jgi:c(7)-type cytochrome triheme protein